MARLQGMLRRLGSGGKWAEPTVSMYFHEALAHHIGAGQPIIRQTPVLFTCGRAAVVVRYAGQREFDRLKRIAPTRVLYIIDDNLFAVGPGDGLPADYRKRLMRYRDTHLQTLLPMVTDVVAPSEAILAGYPDKRTWQLAPARCHAAGGLGHHDDPGPFKIVVAGTRAHLRDVAHVAPALARFLKSTPGAQLTTLFGNDAPSPLTGLPNAMHMKPLDWPSYRRFVAENRFHVAIAPGLETAFNRARSPSKVHDHAGFGAASLYSDRLPFAGIVDHGIHGLLLDDDPATWLAALQQLHSNRAMARHLAASGQLLSQQIGDSERIRAFWSQALEASF